MEDEIKLFGKWGMEEIRIEDPGLDRYLSLRQIIIPRTGGRNTKIQFWKSKTNIVERLMNHLMVPGHKGKKHKLTSGRSGGKALTAYKLVENTLNLIEQKTGQNPIKVFIKAVENAAPREEITTIEYGGARYAKAVECSPQRRIDLAMRYMVQGAYQKSWNTKIKFVNAFVNEILKAYNQDTTSNAIAKKLELERQADSSR